MQRIIAAIGVGLTIGAAAGAGAPPDPAQVKWAADHSIAFDTVEAGNGLDDLAPLKEWIGDARIVSLGECTHGSREVFQMKHRLVEFLATEMGFTIFSIEASMPESYRVGEYVRGGSGDPKQLIAGMYFWTWNTDEVLEMVQWMRRLNAEERGRIDFTGFDMQTPDVAMRIARDFVVQFDPDYLPELEKRYDLARQAQPQAARGGFGVCTGMFPLDAAKGRHVRFRGFIRTKDLAGGRAGLWWRVDGPNGAPLGFDNMQDRGPQGTTDWNEYVIDLDVPAEAVNINFGVIMPGTGTAWFDALAIELDGEAWDDPRFDLDFEGPRFRGLTPMNPTFPATLDREEVHSGKQSMRLESAAPAPAPHVSPADASRACGQVLDHLEVKQEELRRVAGAERADWAIQNARVASQCMQMRMAGGGFVRDRSMAENVAWILEQNPGAKIVLWAHNGHVARQPGAMGLHLHNTFGDQVRVIGFATGDGEYFAVGDNGLGVHPLLPPPDGSVEAVLRATGQPRLILDARPANPADPASAWLAEGRPMRSIGALAMDQQFFPADVKQLYDLLIYIDRTTASVPLTR